MAPHSGGGFTCCVPGCFSNSKRDVNLLFYGFPKEKNLRKRWLHKISRKNFSPSTGHRVCSLHFEGGKKPYMYNVSVNFLWQSPIQDRHPNHGERSFYTGLQHLVKRHRLHSVQQLQAQQRRTAKRPALKKIIGT